MNHAIFFSPFLILTSFPIGVSSAYVYDRAMHTVRPISRSQEICGSSCVQSESIRKALFSTRRFYSIFQSDGFPNIDLSPTQKSIPGIYGSEPIPQIPLTVKDVESPVVIDDRIAFFWDEGNLPRVGNCKNFVYTNAQEAVTICNISSSQRCTRGINGIDDLNRFLFQSVDGDQISAFAWFCPREKTCCSFGCCDIVKKFRILEDFPIWALALISFYGFIGSLVCMGAVVVWCHRHTKGSTEIRSVVDQWYYNINKL